MKKQTKERHLHNKQVFCSLNSLNALCKLLKIDIRQLRLLAEQGQYKTFTIPKRNGGERHIETPGAPLKKVLGRLNFFLQSVYLFERSKAAYGFIAGIHNDDDRRNVMTNAQKHVGRAYLLNIDLKDFFHSVTREKVLQIFLNKPFRFKRELPDILADLTTYKGRLPMGTPTSPVLSNFACRDLDDQLTKYAENMIWKYTRYADDMTFSSNLQIDSDKVHSIRQLISNAGFQVNERKVKVFGPEDEKIVTGLLITDKVMLAPGYLELLKSEIERLKQVFLSQNEQGQFTTRWSDQFKQQIQGRLNFASFVLNRNHSEVVALREAFYEAINPPQEEFGAVSWRGFPYNF